LTAFRQVFERSIANVSALIGGSAFRVTDSKGKALEASVNRALFDAQMLACSWIEGDIDEIDSKLVRHELGNLFSDDAFLDSIRRATGDRARTLKRLRETVGALDNAGAEIQVAFEE